MAELHCSNIIRAHLASSLLLLCCALTLALSGCLGVPLDRDLSYGETPRSQRTGELDIKMEVRIVTEEGAPLAGIDVTVETPRGSDNDVTNSDGTAVVVASVGEDEPIEFQFKSAAHGIDSARPMLSYPRGQARLRMIFKASPRGDVRLAEMEY